MPWRDTDLQLDGPVVAELQKLFLETWEKQKGEPLAAAPTTFRAAATRATRSCVPSAARPTIPTA